MNKIFKNEWLSLFVIFFFITTSTFSLGSCGGGNGGGNEVFVGDGGDGGNGDVNRNSVWGHAYLPDSGDHSGINVFLEGRSEYSCITDSNGYYYISGFPDGTYYISAIREPYPGDRSGPWDFYGTHHENVDLRLGELGDGDQSSDIVFLTTIVPEDPLLLLAKDINSKEIIAVIGEKDSNGKFIKINSVFYITPDGDFVEIKIGSNGLPSTYSDNLGIKVHLTNYTSTTVDLTFTDENDNLIDGPITVQMDSEEISSIIDLYSSFLNLSSYRKHMNSQTDAELLKEISITSKYSAKAVNFVTCIILLKLKLRKRAAIACSTTFLGEFADAAQIDSLSKGLLVVAFYTCLYGVSYEKAAACITIVAELVAEMAAYGAEKILDFDCMYAKIDPYTRTFDYKGGEGSIQVTADDYCQWRIDFPTNFFLKIDSGYLGTGDKLIKYHVEENRTTSTRKSSVNIANQTFTVFQEAATCVISITSPKPPVASFSSSGGTGAVNVDTLDECTWSATSSDPSWIVIYGVTGKGPGRVSYSVKENTDAKSRIGAINIEDKKITIYQEAGECTYDIYPTNRDFDYLGGTGSIEVKTGTECSWTATSNASWITITSGISGTGNGLVSYSVSENTDTEPRTGTMTIVDRLFTVSQNGTEYCSFAGFLSGGWSGTCSYEGESWSEGGSFSFTIHSNCSVSGSYSGTDSGSISGSVSGEGDFYAAGGTAGGVGWSGRITRSDSSLSGGGSWGGNPGGASCNGGWSGSGTASN